MGRCQENHVEDYASFIVTFLSQMTELAHSESFFFFFSKLISLDCLCWKECGYEIITFTTLVLNKNPTMSYLVPQASLASSKSSLSPVSKAANSKVRSAIRERTYCVSV